MRCGNPFTFQPGSVSFWTTIVYIALAIPLLYIHESVPPAPSDQVLSTGLNLTEAWQDLQNITNKFHPYNSHENDRVREFIIRRAEEILRRNGMEYSYELAALSAEQMKNKTLEFDSIKPLRTSGSRAPGVTLFDDQTSNVTWTYNSRKRIGSNIGEDVWSTQYFEGNNFYVYIHGKEDPEGDWWLNESPFKPFRGKGGVLVNCHFDSVSTGYGATDDGMACVSMLQMLSHFTSQGHQPKNGIVLLFNNAEEDGLLGARAFGYSPLLQFCHTFVNLEGAGAGGRAILFRTSDLQAAKAYGGSPHPFGSVVAANAFERGAIKSGTDFEIWTVNYGQRGMDIAFYEPRSRYHTEDDDVRHTSVNSIWHMLSAALASTQKLSQTTGTVFNGPRSDDKKSLVQNGRPTDGVWFDMFGKAWAAFALRGLFAWSLTLLVATPLILIVITFLLIRNDKYYFFAKDIKMHDDLDNDPVVLGGWKGFFRFPLAMIFACGLTIASAFILAKFNPFIIYSSGYSVWAMTLSLFYFTFWLIMRGSSFVRPSALHRGYVNIWLYALGWALQVAAAVFEDRMHIAALYSTVFLQSAVFLSLVISLLEQFALLGKHDFAQQLHDAHQARDRPGRIDPTGADGQDDDGGDGANNVPESPTETTPLRAGETGYGANQQTSFANTYRRSVTENAPSPPSIGSYQPYHHEQTWSGRLPSWTWLFQFLILAPVPVILFGNLGLIALSALQMTGTDGGKVLVPLLALALMSIMLLVPIMPFIHRVTHHVPMFLMCVFIATFIYNLVVFPFSNTYRFKFNFQQVVDLDNGTNTVTLTGVEEYTRAVIRSVPVAAGQDINCSPNSARDLMDCKYDASGSAPNLVPGKEFEELMGITTLEGTDEGIVKIRVDALDTRVCSLQTSRPVFDMEVKGGNPSDARFTKQAPDGVTHIQIWRRDREIPWELTLYLNRNSRRLQANDNEVGEPGKSGIAKQQGHHSNALTRRDEPLEVTLQCGWSDANSEDTIPAFRQLTQYMPSWAVVTKKSVALVEVHKTYKISS